VALDDVTGPEPRYKRAFDRGVIIAAHLSLAPVWLLLWTFIPLAIWLEDRGPVFYRQRRLGRGGRVFTVLKFRTMVPDAETDTGAVWAQSDDPRITRVGRILRPTAMDELPQLINIWRGDMSFVGPRAERPELHEEFASEIPGFSRRLEVRPGLTGLAQVCGAYDLHPAAKLAYDLEYVDRMSFRLDVTIMLRSILNTLLARWDKPQQGNDGGGP